MFPAPHRGVKRWVSPTMRELKKRREMLGPDPLPNRKLFMEWNYNAELYAFAQRLGEPALDPTTLQCAFTHRSYIVEQEQRQRELGIDAPVTNLHDNRELIAEGERLLDTHISIFLSVHLPRFPAAGIAAIANHLMSEPVLANIASHLGVADLVLSAEFPVDSTAMADTLRAIVAVVARSGANEFQFVRDFVCPQLNQCDTNELWTIAEPMAMLRERCTADGLDVPEARLIGDAGQNTLLAAYQVGIYCNKEMLGSGFGENVDVAIEQAARHCLNRLFGTVNPRPFDYTITADECYRLLAERKKYQQKM